MDDNGRDTDRMNSNAGNIGFAASVDTGMNGIHVNVQCEQFTFFNQFAEHWRAGGNAEFAGSSTWCNRNSKIGLSHPGMGEIMLATWLLPYNEGVAQWVDPFYDAGADSHTNIMGSVGAGSSTFYNPVFGRSSGFNRRQENIMQYWSPNWNGFVFRFAWTMGYRDETPHMGGEIDPVIRSSSLAYTNGPLWLAVTWQDHEDWSAAAHGNMESSDAESFRVAGRYIMDLGDGMSVQLSAMWEDVEYEFNGVTSVEQAMQAFGYSNFKGVTSNLMAEAMDGFGMPTKPTYTEPTDSGTAKLTEKTLARIQAMFTGADSGGIVISEAQATTAVPAGTYTLPTFTADSDDYVPDNPHTVAVDPVGTRGNLHMSLADIGDYTNPLANDGSIDTSHADYDAAKANLIVAQQYLAAAQIAGDPAAGATTGFRYQTAYESLVAAANAAALPGVIMTAENDHEQALEDYQTAKDAYTDPTMGQNVKIERDAWMVSGKIKFGGPVDIRFSYADADDLEVSCGGFCTGDWNESGGDAWNVGLFYTMPAGTELRLTYSEVNSDDNVGYGQSIPGTGVGDPGNEIEMFAVGIVHWFD